MKISKKDVIAKFATKHPEAARRLLLWIKTISQISPRNLSELKLSDVGGNAYRVVTIIDYDNQKVYIVDVFTHAEYDRWTQANRKK